MDMVTQVMEKVNEVFDADNLERIARETGFIKRKRKIDPKVFLEKIILLAMDGPNKSLEDLVYEFFLNNTVISKQALHKKINQTAVAFVKTVLDNLFQHALAEPQYYLDKIPFIKNVRVVDSSEIRLNMSLNDIFPQVRNQGAAIKLQAMMDAVNNQVLSLDIRPSKEPDQSYKEHIDFVREGDLLIGDLGYFSVDSFNIMQDNEGYFLSRYFKKTNLYDHNTGEKVDIRLVLGQTKEAQIDLPVYLGESRFQCRLVAIRLTENAYQQRLKNIIETKRKDTRSKVDMADILNRWTIFVTNLSLSVEADILLKLYSLRWQIELFFKMMKTFLNLRKVDSTNPNGALLSLYASLIGMTLLCFCVMTIAHEEISLYKAGKVFIKNIKEFFYLMRIKQCAVTWITEILKKFALKESRPGRPSTKFILGAGYA
jgi:hypothetical protein